MIRWLQWAAAVLSMAWVLGYVGILALTPVGKYALWQADLLALTLLSALCGMLLGLISRHAPALVALASGLAVALFGSIWSAITWTLMGQFFSLPELLIADAVFLFVLQRGAILLIISMLFGLLGATAVLMIVPRHNQA